MDRTSGRQRFASTLIAIGIGCMLGSGADAAPPRQGSPFGTIRDVLDRLDAIDEKLDRLETKLGCDIDEYLEGTCTDPPAAATVTYCIAQGRGIEVAGKFAFEPKVDVNAGAGWTLGPIAEAEAKVSFPFVLPLAPPLFLPVPTEIALGASGSHGKGFDICIEVPLRAAAGDQAAIDRIVRGVNPPAGTLETKYQRRLTRLLNFANQRVPEPKLAGEAATTKAEDVDLDDLDDAMERFMAGEFELFDGPMGMLKDPVVQRIRNALDFPEPVQLVLDDPDLIFGIMPPLSPAGAGQLCDTLNLSGPIANRFPAVGNACNMLANLPSFETTSRAFETVHKINSLLADLPDEVIFGVGEILPDGLDEVALPPKRPPGSAVCNVFPRLCK